MENKLQAVWGSVLGELEIVLSQANYQTWLKGTELADIYNSKAVVYVPNIFTRQWIQDKYHNQIIEAIHKVEPGITTVEYTTKKVASVIPPSRDVNMVKLPTKKPSTPRYHSPSQSTIESYGEFRPNQKYKFNNFINSLKT